MKRLDDGEGGWVHDETENNLPKILRLKMRPNKKKEPIEYFISCL